MVKMKIDLDTLDRIEDYVLNSPDEFNVLIFSRADYELAIKVKMTDVTIEDLDNADEEGFIKIGYLGGHRAKLYLNDKEA